MEAYAVGDRITYAGINYEVIGDGEVKVGMNFGTTGAITIPTSFEYKENETDIDTITYRVTSIGNHAFNGCSSLSSVTIPGNVTRIEGSAFEGCSSLSSVTIPESVTYIGLRAFLGCSSLGSVTIPKSFVLGRGDTEVQNSIFKDCVNLTTVTLSEKISQIPAYMFQGCEKLTTLKILIEKEGAVGFPGHAGDDPIGKDAFDGCPSGRKIEFWDADGKEKLTGNDWNSARDTYLNSYGGDAGTGLWRGWLIEESLIDEPTTYDVTINVKIDGRPWNDHNKTFALLPDSGDFLEASGAPETGGIYKFSGVSNGTYSIYDITGVSADALSSGARAAGIDTGVEVTVSGDNAEATVNYYTATFYDRDADNKEVAYGDTTDQRPQIVLSGQKVTPPITNPTESKDPGKSGQVFDGWKTEDGAAYDFEAGIGGKQKIYASWRSADTPVMQYTITVIKETEGGSINPSGPLVRVNEGDSARFVITPDEGYRIKVVKVDGVDRTDGLEDNPGGGKSYTFIKVTGNHSIRVEFERDGNGGGDNPDPNPNPNPNPGGEDNPNPGGDHSGGGNGGGDSSGGGSDSSDGGDNGGTNQDGGTTNSAGGNNAGDGQATAGTVTSAQAGSSGAGASAGGSKAADKSGSTVNGSAAGTSGQIAGSTGTAANGKEPKTGDASYLQVYATPAMIAGLTYLLLYVLEESRGMSEREKDAFVAAFIRWGKKGGAFRKCCAVAAIFCLLAYYYIIGKNVGGNVLREKHLGQAF